MSIINLNRNNFLEYTGKDGVVLVDVWADWCSPCHQFAPIYDNAAENFGDHIFTKLDVMEDKEFIKELGVENIPTLMVYKDGLLIYKEVGSHPKEVLEEIIRKAEELDMDEVRSRRN